MDRPRFHFGWCSEAFITFKRQVLAALTRFELLEVGRSVDLEVTTNMRHNDLLDVAHGGRRRY